MKTFLLSGLAAALMMAPAAAQVVDEPPLEDTIPQAPGLDDLPEDFEGEDDAGEDTISSVQELLDSVKKPEADKPDYSRLTPEKEREVRLEKLFEKLAEREDEEDANLVAEEIWALWLDSGSDSVNFLMRRGTAAQKRGDLELARRMYNQVKFLEPEYAEGWSRSGRLALEENDLSLALTDVTQALIYEPRHFYALWTMGNIFERLGRQDEAYEAYSETHKLYPGLKAVEEQMKKLQKDVEGDVL